MPTRTCVFPCTRPSMAHFAFLTLLGSITISTAFLTASPMCTNTVTISSNVRSNVPITIHRATCAYTFASTLQVRGHGPLPLTTSQARISRLPSSKDDSVDADISNAGDASSKIKSTPIQSNVKGARLTGTAQQQQPQQSNQQYNRNARKGPPKPKKYNKKSNNNSNKNYYKRNSRQGSQPLEKAKLLNKKLIACESHNDVLEIVASAENALTGVGGGGALNTVNFSTALHRIGRHAFRQDRAAALSDPRFALFLCSLSEALAGIDYTQSLHSIQSKIEAQEPLLTLEPGKKRLTFQSREWSNVAWALAKLKLPPPKTSMPMDISENVLETLVKTSYLTRNQVLEVARQRKQGQSSPNDKVWIPTLSKMSGLLMDSISISLLRTESTVNTQEGANLMWAFATAGRADQQVFNHVATYLMKATDAQTKGGIPLKPQELSNSLWAFATAGFHGEVEEKLIAYVADRLDDSEGFINQYKPQELSNSAWAIATILSNKRNNSSDGTRSNEARKKEDEIVLRILRHVARSITNRADEFKSQELTNTVWSFATMGFGYDGAESANSLNEYIYLSSDDLKGDKVLMSNALDAVSATAQPRLNVFKSQELNNLAWSFARLGQREETLYEGIGREFRQKRRRFSPQDIGTTLWSFATMEYFDADIYRIISSRLTIDQGSRFKPQEMSNTVWALATAQVTAKYPDAFDTTLVPPSRRLSLSQMSDDPVTLCFAAAANELMRRPHEFKSQEIKDILWSFSKMGLRHPPLFKAVAEHLVGPEYDQKNRGRGLGEFSPQGIGNLSWSYAKQAQLSGVAADRLASSGDSTQGRLAVYTTTCIDIGEDQIQKLFSHIAESGLNDHDRLSKFRPQDMSNTAWAFAVLGLRHGGFFDAAASQLAERVSRIVSKQPRDKNIDKMNRFKGQELANIVWAFATLNHPLPGGLDAISPYISHICKNKNGSYDARSIAQQFKRQELANIIWSCAVMGAYPEQLMHLLYAGLIGEGSESNPEFLAQVYNDHGLQKQAIMTLLYVQMIVDIEAPGMRGVALPPNFPEGWDTTISRSGSCVSDNDVIDISAESMLSLTSSKTQMDVGASLHRIGFEHVQEHVIGAEELIENHGIQLASTKSNEILSIDIANLEDKIGIEVDGPAHFITILDDIEKERSTGGAADDPESRGYTKVVNGKLEWQFIWKGHQRMNGPTALKGRLLRHFGWKLLHLPFWEWYALNGKHDKEDEYCAAMLRGGQAPEEGGM